MNRRLTEYRIRSTCREMYRRRGRVSGRQLCAELRKRFGAVGKTERVFAIWREEVAAAIKAAIPVTDLEAENAAMRERVSVAEASARENLRRAELAELREQAHQDKWAMEIDRLRMAAKAQPNYEKELRELHAKLVRLTVELHAARGEAKQQHDQNMALNSTLVK